MRYLIYGGPGIGDFILALPLAAALKRHNPNCYIKMITTSSKNRIMISKRLLSLQEFVDDIDYYSVNEVCHSLKFLLNNGVKQFDYGFVIQYTANENTSVIPSKIVRIASKKTCGMRVPVKKAIKYDTYIEHVDGLRIASYPIKMLAAIGVKDEVVVDYLLNKNAILSYMPKIVYKQSQKNIILCVGTANISYKVNETIISSDSKNWPYEYWIQVANQLAKENYNVFLLGGNKEKEECEAYFTTLSPSIHNLLGVCSIEESLAILCIANIVVGADTGLMHCAGALGKPSLTLFGCTDYNEYLPFGKYSEYLSIHEHCSPCFGTAQSVLCKHHNCMFNMKPDVVLAKIKSIVD